ncbi:6-pyruvoyl trahydropterin synthase family protein [Planomonospora algeriensis]
MFTATVETTWQAGHSLPHLPGRCSSLHGHTWRAALTIAGPSLGPDGLLADFGALKRQMNAWIDSHLDHALMLGVGDNLLPLLEPGPDGAPSPLAAAFTERHQRLFVFGRDFPDALWPSVEGVAQLIAHHAHTWLASATTRTDLYVDQVTVRETDHNSATWRNPDPPGQGAPSAASHAADALRRLLADQPAALAAQLDTDLAALLAGLNRPSLNRNPLKEHL